MSFICFTLILFSEHKWSRETQMKVTLIFISPQNLIYYLFQNPLFFQHRLPIIHAYLKEIGKEHMVTEILDWRLLGAQVRMVSNLNQGSKPSLVEDDRLKTGWVQGNPWENLQVKNCKQYQLQIIRNFTKTRSATCHLSKKVRRELMHWIWVRMSL